MTEKEILQHAKGYIDSLANGIDPLTGNPVAESDIVNNVRISRCLFYVSGILEKVLNGQKAIISREHKSQFSISQDKIGEFEYSTTPIYVSEIANRITSLSADENAKKFPATRITKWLLNKGFFEERTDGTGKNRKYVTDAGKEIGIYQEERDSVHGRYLATLYTTNAQHFIIDNLEAIIAE